MLNESFIIRALVSLIALVVISMFVFVGGIWGIMDALSTLSIAAGLTIFTYLFFVFGGSKRVGIGLLMSFILIVGGFLMSTTIGMMSLVTAMVIFGAILILIYGLTEGNKPETRLFVLVVAAGLIVFTGGISMPFQLSPVIALVLMFFISWGILAAVFSKLFEQTGYLSWVVAISFFILGSGFAYLVWGLPAALLFTVILLIAGWAVKAFPDIEASPNSLVAWLGIGIALLFVFFLSVTQGVFPAILRAFSMVILVTGILTIVLFLRVHKKEIAGIAAIGLFLGTVLTLLGLYLVLF